MMDAADVLAMQEAVSHVKVDESLLDYALEIVERTRQTEQLSLGVSPRGAVMLHRAAQARAFLEGRDYCLPDDFKRLIVPVFAHRVVVSSRYVSTQKKSEQAEAILREILETTRVPLYHATADSMSQHDGGGARLVPAGAISASPCWCFPLRCLLALFSAAAAQAGRIWVAAGVNAQLRSESPAGWRSRSFRRSRGARALRWIAYQVDYRLTREGIIYLGAVFILVLAAVNTGNNLLFMILACSPGGHSDFREYCRASCSLESN